MNKAELQGKTVSVLMNGLKGREAYLGVVQSFDDEWLILDTRGGEYDKVFIRTEAIVSILRRVREYTVNGGSK